MNNKKLIPLLVSTLGIFCAVLAGSLSRSSVKAVSASDKILRSETNYDFGTESTEPPSLTVSITESTQTTLGQSLRINFSTGGDGFSNVNHVYTIVPDKYAEFDSFYKDFNKKSDEEKADIKASVAAGEMETPVYDSYLYNITGKSSYKDVVLPKTLGRDVFFKLNLVRIASKAVTDWTNIKSISIPNTVTEIAADSFVDVPSDMIFNVEFAEGSIPAGWDSNWAHGAVVNYSNYKGTNAEKNASIAAPNPTFGDNNANYMIGYFEENAQHYPLVLEYKVKVDGVTQSETRYYECPLKSSATYYDFVGRGMGSSFVNVELIEDVPLNKNEQIDTSTIKVHNIYPSNSDLKHIDTSVHYVVEPLVLFEHVYNLDEFIDYSFTRLTSFSGYTAFDLNLKISEDNIYSTLKSNYYQSHLAAINSGAEYIRYRLTSLSLGSFDINYVEDGEEVSKNIRISSPIDQVILNKGSNSSISFLIKNSDVSTSKSFKAKNIKGLSFNSFYVTIDIYGDKRPITRSEVSMRFGAVEIMPNGANANLFDLNLFMIIFYVCYLVAFAGGTAFLYFYLSKKYRNDEFKRMKPKSFFKKAALALGGSAVVVGLVLFLIFRTSLFNNAIVVYNPIDAYIIVTGILSVVIIGYFIRYLVIVGKTAKERRKIIKLNLNEDQDEDGTN